MSSTALAWEGRFGDADLKIEIPPSGRIHAEWKTSAGTRTKVVDSIEQLERSVLFQLMVGTDVGDEIREEVSDAVAISLANRRPFPSDDPSQSAKPVRKRPTRPGQQRRRGGPPGGNRPRRRR